jgi:Uma2 family endonuclease
MNPLANRISPEAYLEYERASDVKHEFHDGEMFAMAGASRKHVMIVTNAVVVLGGQLRGKPCTVFSTDLRVRVDATGLFTYPDVVVGCDDLKFADDHEDTLLNPTVIIEVLSKSTEDYDRGTKFKHYRTIAQLQEYVLIAQDELRIEHYRRQPEGRWLLTTFQAIDDVVLLDSINCTLPLAEVYEKVEG